MNAVAGVPTGSWIVAVSGGADSTALLLLLSERTDLKLHIVHLNHQLRGSESDQDARFVKELADRLNLPYTLRNRTDIEPLHNPFPANPSARFRQLRLSLYAQVVREQAAQGVILGHHADDQAETVLHRLLRGAPYSGLIGMRMTSRVGGVLIHRPLLGVRRQSLRAFLGSRGQVWREDSSNTSGQYLRNRLRAWLAGNEKMTRLLLELSEACRQLQAWVKQSAPELPACFEARHLADLPDLLAEYAAKRWLIYHGVAPQACEHRVILRLLEMTRDAASPRQVVFPGGIRVKRQRGRIQVEMSDP